MDDGGGFRPCIFMGYTPNTFLTYSLGFYDIIIRKLENGMWDDL